jgi:hypothetical protein
MSANITKPGESESKPQETDVTRYLVRFVAEGTGGAEGEFVRFQSPMTVDSLAKALPFEGRAARWKEEIYFETPVKLGTEKAKVKVEAAEGAPTAEGEAVPVEGETPAEKKPAAEKRPAAEKKPAVGKKPAAE